MLDTTIAPIQADQAPRLDVPLLESVTRPLVRSDVRSKLGLLVSPVFIIISRAYLLLIHFWMHYIGVPFANYYNLHHMASDGLPSFECVNIERDVQYGDLSSELMDVLAPKEKSSGKFVLYIHGGGFVSVHRGVLNHSITPLVRAGFTVFSIDYPLAPKYRYPSPVVSVLKCLAYIREHYGVSHVQVLGDSAGGCIASMSVAAACNPEGRWHPKVRECLKQHEFPRIEGVALLYSICDVSSWTQRSCNSIGSWCLRAIILVCLALYKSESDDKITLLENIDKVTSFPRTFLLCGHNDILDVSHAALAEALHEKGTHTTTMVLPGFHGFHGLPVPFSLGSWRRTVYPANCALIQWLCNGSDSRVPALPKWSFAEFNLHLPIVLVVLHVVPVYVAWCCL